MKTFKQLLMDNYNSEGRIRYPRIPVDPMQEKINKHPHKDLIHGISGIWNSIAPDVMANETRETLPKDEVHSMIYDLAPAHLKHDHKKKWNSLSMKEQDDILNHAYPDEHYGI